MDELEQKPADMILQAIHLLRKDVVGLNARVDETNKRMEQGFAETNGHVAELNGKLDEARAETKEQLKEQRVFMLQKITALSHKVDLIGQNLGGHIVALRDEVDHLGKQVSQQNARLDNILVGPLGQEVRELRSRMYAVETKLSASCVREDEEPYLRTPAPEEK